MDGSSSWSDIDLSGLLETGSEGWPQGYGYARIGHPSTQRVRTIRPLGLPKAPTHRKRHQALAWLLIPLLATRWDLSDLSFSPHPALRSIGIQASA